MTAVLKTRIRRALTLAATLAIGATGVAVAAAPAQALGAGTACMINAPSGADLGVLGKAGHVGWAFREGTTSTWEYGATENASFNWRDRGDQNAMFNTFRGLLGHGIAHGYYTQWRCEGTPSSSVGAASTKVDQLNKQKYALLDNNCLTRSIEIFKAYDGTFSNMNPGYNTAPNYYFDHLDGAGFGPKHPL